MGRVLMFGHVSSSIWFRFVYSIQPSRFGCRIIQRLLENCDAEELAVVLDPIVASAGKLAKDLLIKLLVLVPL